MPRKRGTLLEIPLTVAAYAILIALLAPHAPAWRLVLLGLVGLGLTHLYCNAMIEEPRKILGLPAYVWTYGLLSLIPGLALRAGFGPGVFLFACLPYLSLRIQLASLKN